MYRLYRTTQVFPATVSQELREIVVAAADAPPGSFRVVQILVPAKPVVKVGVYPDSRMVDSETGTPLQNLAEAIAYNRSYQFATVPPGAYVPLRILPEQSVWACAEEGLAECSLIIEYHEGR